MIISRTPFRISFFGGGTDYPGWFKEHGGAVLAAAIDKYCYISCRYLPPFFEHRFRVVWSKIESCHTADEISHPAVRACLGHFAIDRGVEIHHDADLPARSGMGSSSSFTVGLLHALHALKGQMPNKHQLAQEGIHIEQDVLKETVGSQDQIQAAYGGFNHITFLPNGEFSVRPMVLSRERIHQLGAHIMLFYTGVKRTASEVAASYVNGINDRRRQLRVMKDLAEEAVAILGNGQDIGAFGELLHEAWQVKRSLSTAVSNGHVDDIYDAALSAGAVGGKLTGAGGGGFLLLFVPPDRQASVKEKLKGLIHVPFSFDFSGSQIIFLDQEQDYEREDRMRLVQKTGEFREMSELAGLAGEKVTHENR
jgi:D-glycero-alpha-D-manno-heptose-7-phosphate kinase